MWCSYFYIFNSIFWLSVVGLYRSELFFEVEDDDTRHKIEKLVLEAWGLGY